MIDFSSLSLIPPDRVHLYSDERREKRSVRFDLSPTVIRYEERPSSSESSDCSPPSPRAPDHRDNINLIAELEKCPENKLRRGESQCLFHDEIESKSFSSLPLISSPTSATRDLACHEEWAIQVRKNRMISKSVSRRESLPSTFLLYLHSKA
mmetsp:Transcript_12189/g.18416  ORF Transcript_12189/g.18416 Transcript_12189/m.18416 type:complete len:152 (-) Transcript_12189:102-557(-)